jgi:hypothetical protein
MSKHTAKKKSISTRLAALTARIVPMDSSIILPLFFLHRRKKALG